MQIDPAEYQDLAELVAQVVRAELAAERERRRAQIGEIMDGAGLPDPPSRRDRHGLRLVHGSER